MARFSSRVLATGSLASVLSTLGLALLARLEGKAAVQPTNATGHWLHGEDAGEVRTVDLPHTAVGYGTHHLSALFWAVPLTLLVGERRASVGRIAVTSLATSAFAAAFDYGVMPRRLTPGWEHALKSRGVAAGFGILAVSLAAGAFASNRLLSSPKGRSRDHQPKNSDDRGKRGKTESKPPTEKRVVGGGQLGA